MASVVIVGNSKNILSRSRFPIERGALHPESAALEPTLSHAESFIGESGSAWAACLALPMEHDEKALTAKLDLSRCTENQASLER